MPALRTKPEQWVAEGLRVLAEGGVDNVRIEKVARNLGVTKGGFYGYFTDREDLLNQMLDSWEQALLRAPRDAVDAAVGDSRQKLRRLFTLAAEVGPELEATELAIRNWARHDDAVAARLRRVDNERTSYMRALFADFCTDPADVEGRCHLAMTLFVGNHFVATKHPRLARADVITAALEHLLREG